MTEHSLKVVADLARERDTEVRGIATPIDWRENLLVRERNAARWDAALWRFLAVCGWLLAAAVTVAAIALT